VVRRLRLQFQLGKPSIMPPRVTSPEGSKYSFVTLECFGPSRVGLQCSFRIGPKAINDSAGEIWAWDGNRDAPTITPSIQCQACGLHVTITKGVENPPRNSQ